MGTNDRIIREEQPEEPIFVGDAPSAPRIDLVLGVAMAVIASVLGVLGSLGVGAAPTTGELMRPADQVASAAPMPTATELLTVESPPFDDSIFTFDVVDAPMAVDAPPAPADPSRIAWVIERAKLRLDDADLTDRQRVVRMISAAARVATDDPELDAAIDELTVTVESIVERMARDESACPERQPRLDRTPNRRAGAMLLPALSRGI